MADPIKHFLSDMVDGASMVIDSITKQLKVGVISALQHGAQTEGNLHANATIDSSGFMSATDKADHDALVIFKTVGSLAFYISASGNNANDGLTSGTPWSKTGGLEKARQAMAAYARIDQCVIHLLDAGTYDAPSQPFDGGPFGANGRFAIVGDTFATLLSTKTAASGSTTRIVFNAAISGGIDQYIGKTIEILTGSAAGDRRTIRGHVPKYDCDLATTANITLSGVQTIDGTTTAGTGALGLAKRILVKNQTTQSENGIYEANAGAWTRSLDADLSQLLDDAKVTVTGGTANANTTWYQTTAAPTVGSSNVVWSTSDTVLVPVYPFTAAIAASDTMRVVGSTAILSASAKTIARGFKSGAGIYSLGPSNGFHLVNVSVTAGDAAYIESSMVHAYGVDGGNFVFARCEVNAGIHSSTPDLSWLGQATASHWLGWGASSVGSDVFANLVSNTSFSGFVVQPAAGMAINGATNECQVLLYGGRLGADVNVDGGIFQVSSSTAFVMDGCGFCVTSFGKLFLYGSGGTAGTILAKCMSTSGRRTTLITAVMFGRIYLRANSCFGYSAVSGGINAGQGGVIEFQVGLWVRGSRISSSYKDATVSNLGANADEFTFGGDYIAEGKSTMVIRQE